MNNDTNTILSGKQELDIQEAKEKAYGKGKSEGFKIQKADQHKKKVDKNRKRRKISKASNKKNRKNK
jgi:hypothetical protein